MKIIDNRGRLFGTINLFDLFIIVILILSMTLAFRWIRIAEDPSWAKVKAHYTPCIVTTSLQAFVADSVKEGDLMLNGDGLVTLRVNKILSNVPESPSPPPPVYYYIAQDGEKIAIKSDTMILSYGGKDKIYSKVIDAAQALSDPAEEARRLTLLIEVLTYEKRGKIYSYTTHTPLVLGETIALYAKKYNAQLTIRKILTGGE